MNKEAASIFEASGCLTEQQLMDYLEDRLTEEETHAVEVHMAGCAFCTDALEGLMQVAEKRRIPVILKQLQSQLRRELQSHRSKKKKLKLYVWLSTLIVLVLLILLIAFFAIYFSMKKDSQVPPQPSPKPPAALVFHFPDRASV